MVTNVLDTLRALLAGDDLLQAELAAQGADGFLPALTAIAERHGIAVAPADVAPLAAPDPLGLVRLETPPVRRSGWPAPGWLPYQLSGAPDGSLGVDWADFSGLPADGRFFADAVRQALTRPFNRLLRCRTGFDDFLRGPPEALRRPDGFIFHMSRCGSTLVARMLATLPDTDVVTEPGPLDAMLHLVRGAKASDEWRAGALRAMAGALGRRRSRRWFVKLNAWHVLALPLFREAFPDVPWLFLHRDPAAVIASQMAGRGTELTPELVPSMLYGIADGAALPGAEYCARVLARLSEAALAAEGGLFVDHADLPDAFFTSILPHFGISREATEGAAAPVGEIVRHHAKRPAMPYVPATDIDLAARAAADAHCAAIRADLETVHARQSLL